MPNSFLSYKKNSGVDQGSADYAHEQNVSIMCTADMASFALIDGERVFRIKNGMINFPQN